MKAKDKRQIAVWLYFGAFIMIIQILLGGLTRLTGSGLSITEWKPLIGTLPPLNQTEWQESFDKYKEIAQFHLVNAHFNLEDYKSIFFWEWLHRNWARFIAIAFIVPLAIFIVKKQIDQKLMIPLLVLFLLGLLQGVIGWIMVKSGLNQVNIKVDHIRLAIHFMAALVLLCYTLWLAFSLSLEYIKMADRPKFKTMTVLILILLTIQMIYGAFMAGTNAALAAVTWPDINGVAFPAEVTIENNISLSSLTNDLLTIQFIHRTLAYLTGVLVIILYIRSHKWKTNNTLAYIRSSALLLLLLQIVAGIVTLLSSLSSRYIEYAILHQFIGIALFISLLLFMFMSLKKT